MEWKNILERRREEEEEGVKSRHPTSVNSSHKFDNFHRRQFLPFLEIIPLQISPLGARMSRPLRIEYPGAFYHVMNRGANRSSIFLHEDVDRFHFKKAIGEAVNRWKIRVHAFSFMDNHYHLLIEMPLPNRESEWMGCCLSSSGAASCILEIVFRVLLSLRKYRSFSSGFRLQAYYLRILLRPEVGILIASVHRISKLFLR